MIEVEPFSLGLTRVALAVRETVDAATFAVYHDALGHRTTAEEWERFTRGLLANPPRGADGRPRFPTVAEILDALEEFQGEPALSVEAVQAYERVLAASVYTPEGGASWSFRHVRELCGEAAALAFLAAGGDSAFRTTWNETKRRELFIAEYQAEARESPCTRLLPAAGARKALQSGEESRGERITKGEAAALLKQIAEKASHGA